MREYWFFIGLAAIVLLVMASCTLKQGASSKLPVGDPTGRILNPSLSCIGHCTGYAELGYDWCFCDAVCEKNGNCCSDFKTTCPDVAAGKSTGAEGRTFNPALSCVGHCTGFAESGKDWCFCDALCEKNKNCCSDFATTCKESLQKSSETNTNPIPLQQIAPPDPTGLVRSYPTFMKCSWLSSPELPQVVNNLNELKRLGLNSVCIGQGVDRFNSRINAEDSQRMKLTTLSSIATLKRAGFAIVFILDAGGGPQAEEGYTKLTMQQFLDVVEEEALTWAKLAEEYQVEYFAPANELPSRLHNLLAEYSESERKQKKIEETNKWHSYILPKVREVYQGKVIAELGGYNVGLDPQGYDVIAYGIGHSFMLDLEEFRRNNIQETFKVSIAQAQAANAEWWVGELYFAYEEAFNPNAPAEYATKGQQLQELQDDYHRIVVEEINALPPEQRPIGLAVGGYAPGSLHPKLTIESIKVIRDFFLNKES